MNAILIGLIVVIICLAIYTSREGYIVKSRYTKNFLNNEHPNTLVGYKPPSILPTYFENENTDGPVEIVTDRQRDKYGKYIELDACKYLNKYPSMTYGRIGEGLFRGYAPYSAQGRN